MAAYDSTHALLVNSLVVQLDGGVLRSCCSGTLRSLVAKIDAALAPAAATVSQGRAMPMSFLRGDANDVSKLMALREVAKLILANGPMLYARACIVAMAKRKCFLSKLQSIGCAPDAYRIPDWIESRAGTVQLHSTGDETRANRVQIVTDATRGGPGRP